jgi:hypothetical protein
MYKPKFEKKDSGQIILDNLFDAKDCLEYADRHNMNVMFTETSSSSTIEILMLFQKRGFRHTLFEKSQKAPDGTLLSPKILCLFEKQIAEQERKNGVMEYDQSQYHYWSNSCGETHHWGEYDITPDELPPQLKRVFEDLFWENKFGLNLYLAEVGGKYGISLEANYDSNEITEEGYEAVLHRAKKLAKRLASGFPKAQVFFGKNSYKWSDGSKESIVAVFLPWDTTLADFEEVGEAFGKLAYADL